MIVLYGKEDIRPALPAIQLGHLLPKCTIKLIDGTGILFGKMSRIYLEIIFLAGWTKYLIRELEAKSYAPYII